MSTVIRKFITLIIPFHNDSKYLDYWERAFSFKEINDFIEVVIVDDCSKDTQFNELVERMGEKIRILRNKKNLGPWLTRMAGLDLVNTDYFMFADADDEFENDFLKKFLTHKDFNNHADVVNYGYVKYYSNGKIKKVVYPHDSLITGKKINQHFSEAKLSKPLFSRCYKTSTIKPLFLNVTDKAGKFRVAEDWFAITYLLSKNLIWEFKKEILYKHIKRDDSVTIDSYKTKEVIRIHNNAIYSLIAFLLEDSVENKNVYLHLLRELWNKKSTHYDDQFQASLMKNLRIYPRLLLYPTTWLLILKAFYIKVIR